MTARAGTRAARPRWLTALRLVHPFPSILVAAVTGVIALHAGGRDDLPIASALAFGMLCFQFSIGVTNDLADRREDARRKPWKPLPAHVVSPRSAIVLDLFLIAVGFAVVVPLGPDVLAIAALGLACGLGYDLYLRRTLLSWLPYALALPLVPVWCYAAVDEWDSMLWWMFPLGGVLGLALHLANQAPDSGSPRAASGQGLAGLLGRRRSYIASTLLFGLGALAAAAVLAARSGPRAAVVVALAAVALGATSLAPRWVGRDAVFGILALATAAMAVLFLSSL